MRQKMIPREEMPEASDRQPDSVLRDAIECLPEEMRIPPLLHYMEGLQAREIAGTLGVSLPQITSRLFSGKAAASGHAGRGGGTMKRFKMPSQRENCGRCIRRRMRNLMKPSARRFACFRRRKGETQVKKKLSTSLGDGNPDDSGVDLRSGCRRHGCVRQDGRTDEKTRVVHSCIRRFDEKSVKVGAVQTAAKK